MSLVEDNEHLLIARGFGVSEFGEMLEKAMVRETKYRKKKRFSPSGLGYSGSCPRFHYYAFNGADFEQEDNPLSIANMDAGTAAGERIAKLFDKAGLLVDSELEVKYDDPPIFGYVDVALKWKGEVIPGEVKTTKTETWTYRAKNNTVPGYQLIQLLIYMYILDKERGVFITENKNDHRLFLLPVRMTDERRELVEYVLDWMRTVKENADNGELPKRPFSQKSMQCKGCPLRNTCYDKDYKRGKDGYDPNPGTVDLPALELPK